MEHLFTVESLIAFLTLCALELVLGIDNVIFISILAGRLPAKLQSKARNIGLSLAVVSRMLLLLSISWVVSLTEPLFEVVGKSFSGRDLILFIGGLFLIGKSTHEIHHKLEGADESAKGAGSAKFSSVIIQILLLDVVFSLDSVITAVGMVKEIAIMIAAVLVSTAVMLFSAETISRFVDKHPTIKILALSFLLLIGVTLMADGLGTHIAKGYIYFSMAFSLFVEILNIQLRKKSNPVRLKNSPL